MDRETEDKIQPMLADLGIASWSVTADAFQDHEVLAETLVALWERHKLLEGRWADLAGAMGRVFPDWRMGPMACLPNCQGACCET